MHTYLSPFIQDFKFKQLRKLKIPCEREYGTDSLSSLLAVSNIYGIIFVGTPTKILAIRSSDVIDTGCTANDRRTEATEFPYKEAPLASQPTFIALSSDNLTLLACVVKSGCPVCCFYDVRAFARQVTCCSGVSASVFTQRLVFAGGAGGSVQ